MSLVDPRNKRVASSVIKLNYMQITSNQILIKTKLILSKLMKVMKMKVCRKSLGDSWLSWSRQRS